MLARTLLLLGALAPLAPAQAPATARPQSPTPVDPEALPTSVRNAGVYHVATGTWTRTGGQVANFGPDILYSNTAASGYFTSGGGAGGIFAGSENLDEGGLPGTTNGHPFTGGTGPTRDEYRVDGFQIGYCDQGAAGSSGWEIHFYSSYSLCTVPTTPPDGALALTGLPAGGCWVIQVDLAGSGAEFCLEADGGPDHPGWDDAPDDDRFGWSYRYIGTDGSAPAGFILAGDPKYTDPSWVPSALPTDGTNTFYGAPSPCAGTGTGYLTDDRWFISQPPSVQWCAFLGGYRNRNGCGGPQGNPYASFHMEIYGDVNLDCGPPCIGCTAFCLSNPNSTGVNTSMEVLGDAVALNDDVTLRAANLPPNAFGFFLTSRQQSAMPFVPPNSQGVVCLGAPIGRFIAPGQIKTAGAAGEITLSTTLGEWTLTAIPNAVGTYAAMTGVTSNFQLWHRDLAGGASTSNFSNAVSVTWL
ncbi:MAG: hypothetical protein AAGB93_12525 [Planctomycetota bacterium]